MKPVCIIAGAGDYFDQPITPGPRDYVIAADAGFLRLRERGVRIDEVIGDFDSTGFVPDHPNLQRLPAEKDDTDMLYALRVGIRRGFREFHLFGGTGGRLDHTLANIQCLAWLARQGMRGFLYGDRCVMVAVHNGEIAFDAPEKRIVSVFALGEEALGVSISGLKYAADDICLSCDFPLGVSNETTGTRARVAVKSGTLLLCLPDGAVIA